MYESINVPTSEEAADLFFSHLATLRGYAERIFVEGEELSLEEDDHRDSIAREFRAVGILCEFTEKQLIQLLYAEVL